MLSESTGSNAHDSTAANTATPSVRAVRLMTSSSVIALPAVCGGTSLRKLSTDVSGASRSAKNPATDSPSPLGAEFLFSHCFSTGFELFSDRLSMYDIGSSIT